MARTGTNRTPFSSAAHSSGKINAGSSSSRPSSSNKKNSKGKNGESSRSRILDAVEDDAGKGSSKKGHGRQAGGAAAGMRSKRDAEEQDLEGLNVYDHDQGRVKNSRTQSDRFRLTKDEASLAGIKGYRHNRNNLPGDDNDSRNGSDDDEDDMPARIRRAALMIAGEDALDLGSDDEEVESDDAWEEEGSEEERWGGMLDRMKSGGKDKKGKGKKEEVLKVTPLRVDLNETDDEDLDAPLPSTSKPKKSTKPVKSAFPDESDDDENLEDDEGDELELDLSEGEDMEGSEEELEEDEEEDDEREMSRAEVAAAQRYTYGEGSELDSGSDKEGVASSKSEDEEDEDEDEDEDDDLESNPSLPSDIDMDSDADTADEDGNLMDFVNTLTASSSSGKKRKADEGEVEAGGRGKRAGEGEREGEGKRRRVLPSVRGPGGREDGGDFGVMPTNKLSLASLIAADPSLKATASTLLRTSTSDPSQPKSILKSGTLAAPLPTVVTERVAREAAYEQTKAEGAKWGAAMKRIKEAEHLKFPLQPGVGGEAGSASAKERIRGGVKSGGDLMGNFKPVNDLESAVTRLLESANLKDGQIAQAEEDALESADLTVEEITARRAELRRQRELLFREDSRRKRVAKIKSKTYRKLARKRAGKAGEGEMDLEDLRAIDPERADEEQAKMEAARAKERATLKHSAKGGRWAQTQHGQGEFDGKRQEIEQMLSQGERLKRKIQGKGSDTDESSDSEDEDDADSDDLRDGAFNELASLKARQAELDAEVAASKPSGIHAMKFMQTAAKKKRDEVDAEEAELRRQLEGYDDAGIESGSDEDDNLMRVKGKFVFTGSAAVAPNVTDDGTQPNGTRQRSPSPADHEPMASAPAVAAATRKQAINPFTESQEENPWANIAESSTGRNRKKNAVVGGKEAAAADKATQALKKQKNSKTQDARERLAEDARVEIDASGASSVLPAKANGGKTALPLEQEVEEDAASDEELGPSRIPKAFKQRDLVAQAFAGDNVISDFAAEKKRAVEADAPQEEDMTLAGWGSWGGKGVKQRKNAKKFIKKIAGIEASQRKDFGKNNVIISERKAKADKYLNTSLPFPYTSQAQYEFALSSGTLAPETSTINSFQRATTPRVIKKPGAIIQPLRKLHDV